MTLYRVIMSAVTICAMALRGTIDVILCMFAMTTATVTSLLVARSTGAEFS